MSLDPKRLEDILVEVGRRLLEEGEGALGPWGCTSLSVEVCPEEVDSIVRAGACRVGIGSCPNPTRIGQLATYLDHTLLKPEATVADVDQLCSEAMQHGFASVCVNGTWVRRCCEVLAGSGVLVCSVVGFPLGAMAPEVKAYEARRAIEDGACEVDMVLNVGAHRSGDDAFVRRDIAGVVEVAQRMGARVKVILETCLLTDAQIVRACELAKAARADFVKTSTGFNKGGATVEHIALMRQVVGPAMGVKASGGVRDQAGAKAMIAAGATRIGASASIAIVHGDSGAGSGY